MFRQVDAGFAATLYKYGRGATWGGLVMITAKWDRGQGVPRARERPAPAASPLLACSRLRWRGSEIIVLDLQIVDGADAARDEPLVQDEDQWESLVSDEEDDEDDDSDDDA